MRLVSVCLLMIAMLLAGPAQGDDGYFTEVEAECSEWWFSSEVEGSCTSVQYPLGPVSADFELVPDSGPVALPIADQPAFFVAIAEPSLVTVQISSWQEDCASALISMFHNENVVFQGGKNLYTPLADRSWDAYAPLGSLTFDLPLGPGKLSIVLGSSRSGCAYLATGSVRALEPDSSYFRSAYLSESEWYDVMTLLLRRGIGSFVDLTSLNVEEYYEAETSEEVVRRVSDFCSARAERQSNWFLYETVDENEEISLEISRLAAGYQDERTADVLDLLCNPVASLERGRAALSDLVALATGPDQLQYQLSGEFYDDRVDKDGTANDLRFAFSDALGISPLAVRLRYGMGQCSYVNMLSPPFLVEAGGICYASASFTTPLEAVGFEAPAASNVALSTRAVRTLEAAVKTVLPVGARSVWFSSTDAFVRVKVSDTKGWVSPSSGLWELTYLTAFVQNGQLTVMIDGTVASGAGNIPPPERDFVESMDAADGYNLGEFSQIVGQDIQRYLVGQ